MRAKLGDVEACGRLVMTMRALTADRLIDGESSTPLQDGAVVYDGDRIVAVGPRDEVVEPGMEVHDFPGCTLLPGLADCHLHLSLDGEGSFELGMLKDLTSLTAIRATEYVLRDLTAGFTSIRACADKGFIDVGLARAIDLGYVMGPRVFSSGHMLTVTGGRDSFIPGVSFADNLFEECDGVEGTARAARRQLKYGVDWVKLGVTGAVSAGEGLPGAQQFSEEEMRAAVECAHRYGKKVAGHAHGADGIKAAVRAGVDSIEHGWLADREAVEMMVSAGTYWVPTLAPLHFNLLHGTEGGIPESVVERTRSVQENMLQMFQLGMELGANFVMGTDVGMPFNYHGGNAVELRLMVEAGMSEVDALLSATSSAAEMLDMGEEIGRLAPSLRADVVVVRDDPTNDITTVSDPVFVMKDGIIVRDDMVPVDAG
ncbi:MAG: amidohydrolase family protein [Bacillota bacterium]